MILARNVLFAGAVILELFYILMFILTIRPGKFRFWPPPRARSWQFFTAWLAASLVAVAFFFTGLLDFDSACLPPLWYRLPYGLGLFLAGSAIGGWAALSFNLHTTIGLGERLITRGPYRFCRNPQYIGDSLNALAFMVLVNSWMAWVIGALGILLNVLAPFTEEPWLKEKFGEEYRAYLCRVPRFFPRWRV